MIVQQPGNPLKDHATEQAGFRSRALQGFSLLALCLLLLVARYAWLQWVRHADFVTRSVSNQVHVAPIAPNRGLIYDRRGRVMAENQPAYRLEIVPEKVADLESALDAIAAIVSLSADDRARFEAARKRYKSFEGVPLRFNLSEREVAAFAVNRHRLEGVELVPYLSRHYPFGELATHVLGYVGRLDADDLASVDAAEYRGTTHIGKLGVEKAWEAALHGRAGVERVETNARGRVLRVLEQQDPVNGDDLVLSIDMEVQRAAWDALGDRAGSVVAMDPRDGTVIALVSKPAFDPNLFVRGISQKNFEAILADPGRPLFNRALAGGYEPGSTLKPFVGLAGLETGAIGREQRIWSSGEYYLPNYSRPYRDWREGGHGWVDMRSALEESVNTYFYELARRMGIDAMHDYLAQFGFGAATGIDIPGEAAGLLPSQAWKEAQFKQPWYPGETVIAGIGQGFNVATPLQLANALAALVNDGRRWQPQIVFAAKSAGTDGAQRQPAVLADAIPVHDPLNWEFVREGMRRVVNGPRGSARELAVGAPWVIAGKTGTSQVFTQAQGADRRAEITNEALRHHALFITFAPYDEPIIAMAVVVDHGGGGARVAAPIARAVLDAWLSQELPQALAAGATP